MINKKLIDQISTYAAALSAAASWHDSKETLARVGIKQDQEVGGDYIYEFYCYIRVLSDLVDNYDIEFIKGKGDFETNFPQAPANKKGKPYFILKDKASGEYLYQVCAGTKITGLDEVDRAPDISFQLASASDNPTIDDVVLIFDAKFNRGESDKVKVSHSQLSDVIMMIQDLDLTNKRTHNILFNKFVSFTRNCLLTNGGAHSIDRPAYNNRYSIIEVEYFTVDAKFNIVG